MIARPSLGLRRAILCSVASVLLCCVGCGRIGGETKVIQIEPGVMVQLANDVTADVLIPTENGFESARIRLRAGWYCGPLPELDDNDLPDPPEKPWYRRWLAGAK